MKKCFVIQPFDNGKYDKRYKDVYESAIKEAGLEPYRVDNDYAASIPIDEIENKIKESELVFAEISEDNPNVWYELGYAIASKKEVIMVCSEERKKFPFDVQHRLIVTYRNDSVSDFDELREKITNRIRAILEKISRVNAIEPPLTMHFEGLDELEINCLALITAYDFEDSDAIGVYQLQNELEKMRYNKLATSIAIKQLKRKNMIKPVPVMDWNRNEYIGFRLTEQGDDWVLNNYSKLMLKESNANDIAVELDDEIPF